MLQDLPPDRETAPDSVKTATAESLGVPARIADRYEVIRLIGGGGMGRVFVAYDQSLRRNVAIKMLAPRFVGNPEFAEQLLREARAAAQLDHPHIATIHDVIDCDGAVCIVMELLRGEPLEKRIRRRALTGPQVLRYSRQIAAALKHAHAREIVHCDLTPANVFITEDDVAKVVDFGLARAIHRPPGATTDAIGASSELVARRPGTPGFMSPEQRLGLEVDQRSDIYSFGSVMRAMAVAVDPPAPRTGWRWPRAAGKSDAVRASVSMVLSPIIEKALEQDLTQRYQSAAEVDNALLAIPEGAVAKSDSWAQYAIAVGGLVAIVAVLLIGLQVYRPSTTVSARSFGIGVPLFASPANDPSLGYLAAGLSEMIANDLGASNAVLTTRSTHLVASGEDASALLKELGVGSLLLGSVERRDEGLTVGIQLYPAGSEAVGKTVSFTKSANDLAGISRALSLTVRTQLASAGYVISRAPKPGQGAAQSLLPRSMQTFEEYAQARWFLDRADIATNVDHALTLLERIVKNEPAFALGEAALGEATWRKWLSTKDRSWAEAAERHTLEALRLSSEQPEVRYSVALIYQGTGRRAEAIGELERVAQARPLNDDVQRLLGRLYSEAGRLDDGLKALQRAVTLRPGYWNNHATLGNVAFRAGRYDVAVAAFQRFCELRPDSASAYQRLGTAYHAAGNVPAALESYGRALQISPNANAYSNVGTIHYDERRYKQAIEAYQKAIDMEPRNASFRRNLGDALRRDGQPKLARDAYNRAIELSTEMLRVNPRDASTVSLKAISMARTGRFGLAGSLSNDALALSPRDGDVLFERATILLLTGNTQAAIGTLRRAVEAGYSVKRLAADPDLASLATVPDFRQLLELQR